MDDERLRSQMARAQDAAKEIAEGLLEKIVRERAIEDTRLVTRTLRYALQPGFDPVALAELIDQLEVSGNPADWLCCPVCEETTCDVDCPLKAHDHFRVGPPK